MAMSISTSARRIVIKVGSTLLVDADTLQPRLEWLDTFVDDVTELVEKGSKIVVVTSGAVALGKSSLARSASVDDVSHKQAAAAIGQIRLAHLYHRSFRRTGLQAAEVLLTPNDVASAPQCDNARRTLMALLAAKAIPIINKNDSTATEEIRFGDNDRLAALVVQLVEADTLLLLSDTDGLYTADPKLCSFARHLPDVYEITDEIEAMAGPEGSGAGSGGMITKLIAARIAMACDCRVVIAYGLRNHPLKQIGPSGRATWFHPQDRSFVPALPECCSSERRSAD